MGTGQGRTAEAVELFQEAVQDDAEYADAYVNWGLALAAQGEFREAKLRIESALSLSPEHAKATAA